MTADELLAIRGTPEFEVEYRRQLSIVAEHDRGNHFADHLEPDWESLDKTWR